MIFHNNNCVIKSNDGLLCCKCRMFHIPMPRLCEQPTKWIVWQNEQIVNHNELWSCTNPKQEFTWQSQWGRNHVTMKNYILTIPDKPLAHKTDVATWHCHDDTCNSLQQNLWRTSYHQAPSTMLRLLLQHNAAHIALQVIHGPSPKTCVPATWLYFSKFTTKLVKNWRVT